MDFENFEKFLNSVSEDLKKIFEHEKEYLCCKKGCALCCKRGDYPLSEIEYNYMKLAFDELASEVKLQIREQIEKVKKGNKDSYECPFLIDDVCSIYSHRPFVCRTFGVLTENAEGNPAFPFCTVEGLNYHKIYDEKEQHLSAKLVYENFFSKFPKIFRLSNKVIMQLPLAKQLEIDFGKTGKMVDFLIEDNIFKD